MKTDIEVAGEYESKFRFYFVALVFTLLAASVQSAPLTEMSYFSKFSEVIGWLALLTSGLSSLSFLEFSAVIYNHRDTIKNTNISDNAKDGILDQLTGIQEMSSLKYKIAKYSFVLGLVAIITSRGTHGLVAC